MLAGTRSARRSYRAGLARQASPEAGIRAFFAAAGAEPAGRPAESPIFIFAAGWRSGSTLLQRLVASDGRVLIWGEPYDRSGIVQALARSLAPFSASWPPPGYPQASGSLAGLPESWLANLYPPPAALRTALRGLFLELFAVPARAQGASRWGFKEVRFGLAEALLLKGLFPDARFLFLRRDLEAAYLSYKGFSGSMDWYASWPRQPVFTPWAFARHRAGIIGEFEAALAATAGLLIDYAELASGRIDLARISAHCGVRIDAAILAGRVGSGLKDGKPLPLTRLEKLLLRAGDAAGRRGS